jgi:hypothetical protein
MSSSEPSKTSMVLIGAVHLLVPTIAMFALCVATAKEPTAALVSNTTSSEGHGRHDLFAILGGALYTLTGTANLFLLRSDTKLSPAMAYTNSIMAWSSFFFGPAIAFIHMSSLRFTLSYGRWYAVPNYGWGVEWALQLLGQAGSGTRAYVIMALSIASYFLTFAFDDPDIGFNIAFLPQVVVCVAMCVVCFCRFRSVAAGRALALWVSACTLFLILHTVHPKTVTGDTVLTIVTQCCDCTQIHFSIRFFVCMFRSKHARTAVAPANLPTVSTTPETAGLDDADTFNPVLRDGTLGRVLVGAKVEKPPIREKWQPSNREAAGSFWR